MKETVLFFFFFLFYCISVFADEAKLNLMDQFCDNFNQKIKQYGWGKIVCNPTSWTPTEGLLTKNGMPLVFKELDIGTPKNTTLVLCGVHGDELTAIYPCIHLLRDILYDNPKDYKDVKIVIAPLVNPDGFFVKKPTRNNANKIDPNRNFPTKDFGISALKSWEKKEKKDYRKYPGTVGGSEIETQFQMKLLEKFSPDKIITIHAPYGWLDVDLPKETLEMRMTKFLDKAKDIGKSMSRNSNNYPLTNFNVFPGSLGNYAAYERGIPTYTLELPTVKSELAHSYWLRIRKAMVLAINYELKVQKSE